MSSVIRFIKERGKADAAPNERGNLIWRLHMDDERYLIDFADDFNSEGWMQFDTDQDAWYFGAWVNPSKLLTLNYAEGDWCVVECPDADHYNAEVADMCRFYREGFVAKAIDADGTVTVFQQDRSEFFLKGGGECVSLAS